MVRCRGECRLIEATWEKQDFEAEITRQGFSHDDFAIEVERHEADGLRRGYGMHYSVTVHESKTGCSITYRGGHREAWVHRFAVDLAKGTFGPPPPKDVRARAG